MSRTREQLKQILPSSLIGFGRGIIVCFCRLRTWRAVMTELKGASPVDQGILRRSLRRGIVQAAKDPDQWQDPQLVEDANISVPGIGRFALRAFSDDLYQVLPSQEAAVLAEIRARLRPGSTFVDCGANIGFFTVIASRLVGPTGKVFAIEMMPVTSDRLRQHVEANELTNVTVFQSALSDRTGESVIAFLPESSHGQASIVRRENERGLEVTVTTRTLDDLLGDEPGPIDLVKMDIEGAEALALKGAEKVLSRTRAVIFEQLEDSASAGDLLSTAGFAIRVLDPRNRLAERDRQ